jgi:hypothetical protein
MPFLSTFAYKSSMDYWYEQINAQNLDYTHVIHIRILLDPPAQSPGFNLGNSDPDSSAQLPPSAEHVSQCLAHVSVPILARSLAHVPVPSTHSIRSGAAMALFLACSSQVLEWTTGMSKSRLNNPCHSQHRVNPRQHRLSP